MSDSRVFFFYAKDHRRPVIDYLLDYSISEEKGYLYFGGYYYVLNEEFPIRIFFTTTLYEDEPYEVVETPHGDHKKYKQIEERHYEVEIYDREKVKDTSEFGEEEDEDGSTMRVCFFPTHEQKILFRVINKFEDFESFLKRTTEYFTETQAES